MLGRGFCVARILGVRICVDWGLLFLLGLLTVNLGAGFLPTWHPDWGLPLSLGLGLLAALSFLASILLHELSHALVGRMFHIPINSITLFIFGGAANMEEEPPSAKSEFLMAAVGPLASLVIGASCLAAVYPALRDLVASGNSASLARLGPATTLLVWLGPTNLVLAAFNLIPAFPLDGGRVLRSMLWGATGNVDAATMIAATAGRVLAWGLIGLGAAMLLGVHVPYVGGGMGQGLWLGLIGWFVDSAAAEAMRRQRAVSALSRRTVAQLMRPGAVGARPDTTLEDLSRSLTATDQAVFPVLLGDLVVGLVDLGRMRKVPRDRWPETEVRELMMLRSEFEVLAPADSGAEGLHLLQETTLPALPVLDAARLVGLLHHADLDRFVRSQQLRKRIRARRARAAQERQAPSAPRVRRRVEPAPAPDDHPVG